MMYDNVTSVPTYGNGPEDPLKRMECIADVIKETAGIQEETIVKLIEIMTFLKGADETPIKDIRDRDVNCLSDATRSVRENASRIRAIVYDIGASLGS